MCEMDKYLELEDIIFQRIYRSMKNIWLHAEALDKLDIDQRAKQVVGYIIKEIKSAEA